MLYYVSYYYGTFSQAEIDVSVEGSDARCVGSGDYDYTYMV